MNKRHFLGALAWALALGAGAAACGSSADSPPTGTGATAGSGQGGAGGSGGTGGTGGSLVIDSGPQGDGALNDTNACAADHEKAEPLPLDLYFMMDSSGSMGQGSGKWEAVSAALDAFMKDPASVGLGVGLNFFPGYPECNAGTYSSPSVPIMPLPGIQPAMSAAMTATVPAGGTPTLPAMQGALTYAQSYASANPTHTVMIVLATDGQPNDCSSTVQNVTDVALSGATGTPKVQTFVIGVGTDLSNLDAIAQAGGTNTAYIVDTFAGNVTQQFVGALNAIRGAARACEYQIPTPEGGAIDYAKVNVEYTPTSGGQPQQWPNYPDAAACPPSGDGWYYDTDPAVSPPTKVLLCPGACSKVKQDPIGPVDVLFGCATIHPA